MSEKHESTFIVGGNEVTIAHDPEWRMKEKEVSNEKGVLLCSLIWVSYAIVNMASGFVRLVIKGVNPDTNEPFEVVTDCANLQPSYNNQLIKDLCNRGVVIYDGQYKEVLLFLSSQRRTIYYGVDRLGWHQDGDKYLFVLPGKVIGGHPDKNYRYMPNGYTPAQSAIREAGTLAEWQHHVLAACIENLLPLFVLGASFAAPLLLLLRLGSGGFHFFAISSDGKTIQLQIAISVWGNASDPSYMPDKTLVQQWNTTENGLDGIAQLFKDLPLALDELGSNNASNFGRVVYRLSSGSEKVTMTPNREMRTPKTWRAMLLSSGEHAVADEIEASTGRQAATGQSIRLIDIKIDGKAFPAWLGQPDIGDKATALKKACGTYYGTAALPYVRHIVEVANSPELTKQLLADYDQIQQQLLAEFPNLKPEQKRAIQRFAAVACGLMQDKAAGCIEVEQDKIIECVKYVLNLWLAHFPSVSEADRGLAHLMHFINANPYRFGDAEADRLIGVKLLGWKHNEKRIVVIPPESMPEVCGRRNYEGVVKRLVAMDMLDMNNTNNNGTRRLRYKLRLPDGTFMYGFAISYDLFDDGTDAD